MLQTRFLLFAALKETYSENPEALDEAMAMVALDLHCALHTGVPVVVNGLQLRLRFCVCSVKGDWPFLIEAAHLERHFRRAPKRGESSPSSPGVCHLCLGGVSGISYTDFSTSPDWERTMDSAAAQVPWHSVSPWHSLPAIKDFRPFTFRPDLFHGFHLGHGRYFLSSALVVLQQLEEGDGVETRFQQLSRKWLQYCRSVRVPWQKCILSPSLVVFAFLHVIGILFTKMLPLHDVPGTAVPAKDFSRIFRLHEPFGLAGRQVAKG